MEFQILDVVVWPKRNGFVPRRVSFSPGKVNVISGQSKRGKSAIIPIIDYCLCSSKCLIPPGPIRQHSSWFGVRIQLRDGQLLLARKEPGNKPVSSEMFIQEGENLDLDAVVMERNTDVHNVKERLNQLAQLSNLRLSEDERDSFSARAGFRDLMAFCFQPQNIIANPQALFYGTDITEHRERLKRIFPYALGALDAELFMKKWDLIELLRRRHGFERQLAGLEKEKDRNTEVLRLLYLHALELGLLSVESKGLNTVEEYVAVLRKALRMVSDSEPANDEALSALRSELHRLDEREVLVSRTMSQLSQRQERLSSLFTSIEGSQAATETQKDRLGIAAWLRKQAAEPGECPFCLSPMRLQVANLESLCSSLEAIENIATVPWIPQEAYDLEMLEIKRELAEARENLKAVKGAQEDLQNRHTELQQERFVKERIDRFLGRLERSLETYDDDIELIELRLLIEELDREISSLEKLVSDDAIRYRTSAQLKKLHAEMQLMIPKTDAEFPEAMVQLDINDLTLKISTIDNEYYLSELGSGANWLAYHVVASLALQGHFHKLKNSPVPGFLIFDQPSQVYFPSHIGYKYAKPGLGEEEEEDRDVANVRDLFELMCSQEAIAKKGIQVIVLEHVPKSVWGSLENTHEVEDYWREGGGALIPEEWCS